MYYNNEDIRVIKILHFIKSEVNSSGDKILIKYFHSLYEDH